MLGAIIGDIVGSRFEFNNHRSKDFEFFHKGCFYTDDSVMTIAVANALVKAAPDYKRLYIENIKEMKTLGHAYPHAGYGDGFKRWLKSGDHEVFDSYGNGAAMRVSPCGFIAKNMNQVKYLSREVTRNSHNHPEGLKGAEATAAAVFLAKNGSSKEEIRKYIEKNYYDLNFTIDGIRGIYRYRVSCQETVPQSIVAFLEGKDYEDVIRNAISIGGDSDTIGAIAGGIAEAYFGIPNSLKKKARTYLDARLLKSVDDFYTKISGNNSHGIFDKIKSMFDF